MYNKDVIKEVKVGPYTIRITRDDIGRRHSDIGEFYSDGMEIIIDNEIDGLLLADTLLHEIIHAINYVMGYKDDDHDDDRYVTALSVMLLQTMRENPGLMEVLLDEDI